MTFETLRNFRFQLLELQMILCEIETLYNTYLSPSFSRIGSRPLSPSDPTAMAFHKITQLQSTYYRKLNALLISQSDIESWLLNQEDRELAAIVRSRFLAGLSWQETARCLGKGYTKDMVRKKVTRYFENQEKNA